MIPSFSRIFSHDIYIVGGAVRDLLLNEPIYDIDIASSLEPNDFKALCKKLNFHTFDSGIMHGTISVIIDNQQYEHTTFRKDISCDGRNATISYAKTITEDLARRDFTINAMALLNDEIIDPYQGKQDLENKLLRAVGSAKKRFKEDYLRIVRAARFAARFNFKLCSDIIEASHQYKDEIIKFVSIERIVDELIKSKKFVHQFFLYCQKLKILDILFPFIDNINDTKYIKYLNQAKENSEEIYLACLFALTDQNKLPKYCKKYKLSNKNTANIIAVNSYHLILTTQKLTLEKFYDIYIKCSNLAFIFKFCNKILPSETLVHNEKIFNYIEKEAPNKFVTGDILKQYLPPCKHYKNLLNQAFLWQLQQIPQDEVLIKVKQEIALLT